MKYLQIERCPCYIFKKSNIRKNRKSDYNIFASSFCGFRLTVYGRYSKYNKNRRSREYLQWLFFKKKHLTGKKLRPVTGTDFEGHYHYNVELDCTRDNNSSVEAVTAWAKIVHATAILKRAIRFRSGGIVNRHETRGTHLHRHLRVLRYNDIRGKRV